MIQPGQKLKEGDYFQGGTKEQYLELLKIDGQEQVNFTHDDEAKIAFENYDGLIFDPNYRLQYLSFDSEEDNTITEYTFTDFKQLCENTFGA